MIEIYSLSQKVFNFEVVIEGIHYASLTAYLRIRIEDFELGFPGEVSKENIVITVPALRKITTLELNNTYEARLEVFGNGFYLVPWRDQVVIKPTVKIEEVAIKSNLPRIILKTPEGV